ncbi:MAG: diphthine--ammonia ligase [Aigarchaeota archaeon]|nr:diphthine--ammonia ligase [Aigarchaeota archaeon]MDW8092120.1 diphthine--ammonia ligase [Nitrososphaerota archaeon]
MRLLALYSGGKDSTLALEKVIRSGHEVVLLVTARPQRADSWMLHSVALDAVEYQAVAIGLPLIYVEVSGVKEVEVGELRSALLDLIRAHGVEGIVSGGISSRYQFERLKEISERLDVELISPNWGMRGEDVLSEAVERGYRIMITSVSAHGLTKEWLGHVITKDDVRSLVSLSERYGFDVAGEGGDLETLVLDCPIFKMSLDVQFDRVWLGDRGYVVLKSIRLISKG